MIFNINILHNADYFRFFAASNVNNNLIISIMRYIYPISECFMCLYLGADFQFDYMSISQCECLDLDYSFNAL